MFDLKKYFTMVELLLVVSFLFILFSLLAPSLKKALAQSEQIHCANNLKQLAIGVEYYQNDHFDEMPTAFFPSNSQGQIPNYPRDKNSADNMFIEMDELYFKSKSPFYCVSDEYADPRRPHRTYATSYGVPSRGRNIAVFGAYHRNYTTATIDYISRWRTDFQRPSNYIMIADSGSEENIQERYKAWINLRPGQNGMTYEGQISNRHYYMPNFAALDGHVESVDMLVGQLQRRPQPNQGAYVYWWNENFDRN